MLVQEGEEGGEGGQQIVQPPQIDLVEEDQSVERENKRGGGEGTGEQT